MRSSLEPPDSRPTRPRAGLPRLASRLASDRSLPRGASPSPPLRKRRSGTDETPSELALDGARPASARSSTRLLPQRAGMGRGVARFGASPPRRGVFDHARGCRAASDAPCRAPRAHRLSAGRLSRSTEDRSHAALVKARRFFDPKRLPSTNAPEGPLARFPLDRGSWTWSPPPVSRLRRRDPASDVGSPRGRSRAAWLDPPLRHRLIAERERSGRTPFVDFCKRNVPRARPRLVRAPLHRAHGRPYVQLHPDLARLAISRAARPLPETRVAVASCPTSRSRAPP